MNYNYECKNIVYIRNLSPTVTDDDVRSFFSDCGDIISVTFHNLAGNNRRYLKVEFKDSAGVIGAALKNGHPLCGWPMVISVMDPRLSYESEAKSGAVSAAVAQLSNSAMCGFYGANSKQSKAIEAIMYYGTNSTLSSNVSDAAKLLASQTECLLPTHTSSSIFLRVQYHPDIQDSYLKSTFSNAVKIKISSYKSSIGDKTAILEFNRDDHAEDALKVKNILDRKITITRITNQVTSGDSVTSKIGQMDDSEDKIPESEHRQQIIRSPSIDHYYRHRRSRHDHNRSNLHHTGHRYHSRSRFRPRDRNGRSGSRDRDERYRSRGGRSRHTRRSILNTWDVNVHH